MAEPGGRQLVPTKERAETRTRIPPKRRQKPHRHGASKRPQRPSFGGWGCNGAVGKGLARGYRNWASAGALGRAARGSGSRSGGRGRGPLRAPAAKPGEGGEIEILWGRNQHRRSNHYSNRPTQDLPSSGVGGSNPDTTSMYKASPPGYASRSASLPGYGRRFLWGSTNVRERGPQEANEGRARIERVPGRPFSIRMGRS